MKKLLLSLLLLPTLTTPWQYYSYFEHRYYTLPEAPEIDAQEYHELSCLLSVLNRELANSKMCFSHRQEAIKKFLTDENTPVSLRLLADIEEMFA